VDTTVQINTNPTSASKNIPKIANIDAMHMQINKSIHNSSFTHTFGDWRLLSNSLPERSSNSTGTLTSDIGNNLKCQRYLMSEIEDWSQLAPYGAARGLAEAQPVNLNFSGVQGG
jgi:hypothetical protein